MICNAQLCVSYCNYFLPLVNGLRIDGKNIGYSWSWQNRQRSCTSNAIIWNEGLTLKYKNIFFSNHNTKLTQSPCLIGAKI